MDLSWIYVLDLYFDGNQYSIHEKPLLMNDVGESPWFNGMYMLMLNRWLNICGNHPINGNR